MGSAVDRDGLSTELASLKEAGIGGVEITPIYGAGGSEARFVPYLSDEWVSLLEHTLAQAKRLDLGVDMATGTGWPFGGPWVGDRDACRTLAFRTWKLEGGTQLTESVRLDQPALLRAIGNQIYEVLEVGKGEPSPRGTRAQPLLRPNARSLTIADIAEPVEANKELQALALEQVRYPKPMPLVALVAYPAKGDPIDLTSHVTAAGTLEWTAPPGTWTLYGVFLGWHGKLVERAAPGGEGNVIDHFSRDAIRHYLERFDRAFGGHRLEGLRGFFNDSYEVDDATGESDWTPEFFDEFQKRRGYDLRRQLPALLGTSPDTQRVVADYRLTIADLLRDTFTTEWRDWAKRRGAIVRNQAHGSPGNLLDLYALSDIPETEGTEIPRARWATSAAHVAGRRLVSAEAATWLGEHFRSTLADVRAAVDRFFVAGVNHIVYHGTAYSPPGEPWPGWLFYASVEFNSRNSWWRDFAALNQYVARAQSFLQAGAPDQDVLLYYPFYDELAIQTQPRLRHFGGGNPKPEGTQVEFAADLLERRGFTYDYISDRQLESVRVEGDRLITGGGGSYKTLIIPAGQFVSLETFERFMALAKQGAVLIAFSSLPADVSGLVDLNSRRARLQQMRAELNFGAYDTSGVAEARIGRGAVLRGKDLEALLTRTGVTRESLVDWGVSFTRRRHESGRSYFLANMTDRDVDGWIRLDDRAARVVLFDPMTAQRGDARTATTASGTLDVQLTIPAHTSIIAVTTDSPVGRTFRFARSTEPAIPLAGPWRLRFVSGGPALPAARQLDRLGSWTENAGDDLKAFSGTASYTTRFKRPAGQAAAWLLDLGAVKDSACVRLNGHDLGTVIGPTFRVIVDDAEFKDTNDLEIEVTNLMANRIAALDRARVPWRRFYNVNFPARLPENRGSDGLFTAAAWPPLESGLLGPVTIAPLDVPR